MIESGWAGRGRFGAALDSIIAAGGSLLEGRS